MAKLLENLPHFCNKQSKTVEAQDIRAHGGCPSLKDFNFIKPISSD